ncbi:MAG: hypothetical protein KF708_24490 [Pirellulales bacterium]|nr:hypothetical protein [Pirellulales bacterium]
MQRLRPTIDRDTARARLERARRGSLARWLFGAAKPAAMARLELVSLPYYLVEFAVDLEQHSLKLSALVGGHEPIVELHDLAGIEWEPVPLGEQFAPRLDVVEAEELARRQARAFCASRRRWRGKGHRLELVRSETIAYPYWAFYYERWAGKYDVRLLDAVSGRPAGSRVKVALLAALSARRDLVARGNHLFLETAVTAP